MLDIYIINKLKNDSCLCQNRKKTDNSEAKLK